MLQFSCLCGTCFGFFEKKKKVDGRKKGSQIPFLNVVWKLGKPETFFGNANLLILRPKHSVHTIFT